MKKQTALTVALLLALGALAACSAKRERQSMNETVQESDAVIYDHTPEETASEVKSVNFIGEEKAKELAAARAGLAPDAVSFEEVELDEEDGVWKYDVEFTHNKKDYSAEVNAENGEILLWEVEEE